MDDLTQTLVDRQMKSQNESVSRPAVIPNASTGRIPPKQQRWANAQRIQNAWANGGDPNPTILQIMLARH